MRFHNFPEWLARVVNCLPLLLTAIKPQNSQLLKFSPSKRSRYIHVYVFCSVLLSYMKVLKALLQGGALYL